MRYVLTLLFLLVCSIVYAGGRFIGPYWISDESFINGPFAFDANVGIGTTNIPGRLILQGAGTTTGITFQTKDSSGAIKTTILDNGNVGVGTSLPTTKIQVVGTTTSTAFVGPLTGNVTGNVVGNLTGNVTGNADTATAIANPTYEAVFFLALNVNMKVEATTSMGTTENAGRRFFPTFAVAVGHTVTDLIDVGSATIQSTITASSGDINATNVFHKFDVTTGTSFAPNTTVNFTVDTAADATAYTVDVYLIGFYK